MTRILAPLGVVVAGVVLLTVPGMTRPATAEDMPKLSSSLAKNLWRQCHMYYEDGLDAKAKRACSELKAWAEENNESGVAQETAGMLADLEARTQPVPVQAAPKAPKKSEIQADDPACGFGTADDIPTHHMMKIVTGTPPEFLTCSSDADCVLAKGFCGVKVAVSKTAQACFETAVRKFETTVACDADSGMEAGVRCHNNTCMVQF